MRGGTENYRKEPHTAIGKGHTFFLHFLLQILMAGLQFPMLIEQLLVMVDQFLVESAPDSGAQLQVQEVSAGC